MYLGHLIFSPGLVLAYRSPIAAVLFLSRLAYFSRQVAINEARLEEVFGEEYRSYQRTVRRWIPWIL